MSGGRRFVPWLRTNVCYAIGQMWYKQIGVLQSASVNVDIGSIFCCKILILYIYAIKIGEISYFPKCCAAFLGCHIKTGRVQAFNSHLDVPKYFKR